MQLHPCGDRTHLHWHMSILMEARKDTSYMCVILSAVVDGCSCQGCQWCLHLILPQWPSGLVLVFLFSCSAPPILSSLPQDTPVLTLSIPQGVLLLQCAKLYAQVQDIFPPATLTGQSDQAKCWLELHALCTVAHACQYLIFTWDYRW